MEHHRSVRHISVELLRRNSGVGPYRDNFKHGIHARRRGALKFGDRAKRSTGLVRGWRVDRLCSSSDVFGKRVDRNRRRVWCGALGELSSIGIGNWNVVVHDWAAGCALE